MYDDLPSGLHLNILPKPSSSHAAAPEADRPPWLRLKKASFRVFRELTKSHPTIDSAFGVDYMGDSPPIGIPRFRLWGVY